MSDTATRLRQAAGVTEWRLDDLTQSITCTDPGDREPLGVTAPFTGDQIGTVPACTAADVDTAVKRARTAQEEWETLPLAERADRLEAFASLFADRREAVVDLLQLETGKARQDAITELLPVASVAEYYAEKATELLAPKRREGAMPLLTKAREYHAPVGVVGVISPWNYPTNLALFDAIPALAAGNAVVLKPDERTPYGACFVAELLRAAGIPADLFQIVTGEGAEVGPALIERVDYLAFTGGTETGRTVAAAAGRNLIDCSLELGGKNPMVVLADADPDRAAKGAVQASFTNAGQLCLAAERIYVHEAVYEPFLRRFVERTAGLTVGANFEDDTDVGVLIDEAHCESVAAAVDAAVEDGATVEHGGCRLPEIGPTAYEPTVLTDVDEEAPINCDETFGPVVAVHSVPDRETAIERANDTEYGLQASVWTDDEALGWDTAEAIEAGAVTINDGYAASAGSIAVPMGGVGDSGIGHRNGEGGLLKYTDATAVVQQRFGPLVAPDWLPNGLANRWLLGLDRVRRLFR